MPINIDMPGIKHLLSIDETEELRSLELEGILSVGEDEKSAKKLIFMILRKFGYIIDVDKELPPPITFKSRKVYESVRPDFLLIHLGNYSQLPNIIPIEVDWSEHEIYRHLPKLARVFPVYIEAFPYQMGSSDKVKLKKIINYAKSVQPYYNILFAPISIQIQERHVRTIMPVYSLRHIIDNGIYEKFMIDLLISLLLLIHHGVIREESSLILKSIIAHIGYKTKLFSLLRRFVSSNFREDRRINISTYIDDGRGRVYSEISSINFKSLYKILRKVGIPV